MTVPSSPTSLSPLQARVAREIVAYIRTGFGQVISAGTPMPNVPEMSAVWGPWGSAVSQSVQKPNPNYTAILAAALKEIRGNIK